MTHHYIPTAYEMAPLPSSDLARIAELQGNLNYELHKFQAHASFDQCRRCGNPTYTVKERGKALCAEGDLIARRADRIMATLAPYYFENRVPVATRHDEPAANGLVSVIREGFFMPAVTAPRPPRRRESISSGRRVSIHQERPARSNAQPAYHPAAVPRYVPVTSTVIPTGSTAQEDLNRLHRAQSLAPPSPEATYSTRHSRTPRHGHSPRSSTSSIPTDPRTSGTNLAVPQGVEYASDSGCSSAGSKSVRFRQSVEVVRFTE